MAAHYLLKAEARDITLDDIEEMSDAAVRNLFLVARWGCTDKQTCPECGTMDAHYWKPTRKQWQCKADGCQCTFSLFSATKFADHKLKPKKMLRMLFTFVTHAKGVSAIHMSREHGVSHKTAYVFMHKLREAIMVSVDVAKLAGVVHVDGAHAGGKVRKANKKAERQKRQQRDKIPDFATQLHPNRRILMVGRTVKAGAGGVRSVVAAVRGETEANVIPFVRKHIKAGSTLHTDENPAYSSLGGSYNHQSVNHGTEFQSDAGVDNNQAESFFTRFRRMFFGQLHRLTPKYLVDYASEIAWREDTRKKSARFMLEQLLAMAMRTGLSAFWRGYHQGHHRESEILFPKTVAEAVVEARAQAEDHALRRATRQSEKVKATQPPFDRPWPTAPPK